MISKNTKKQISCLRNELFRTFKLSDCERKRQRKILSKHLFYQQILATSQQLGYQTSTTHLADSSKTDISPQALNKSLGMYGKELAINILDLLSKGKRRGRFIAVDGSRLNLNASIAKNETDYKLVPSGSYTTALLTTFYDIESKVPLKVVLTGHHDERRAAISQFKWLKAGDILIFDRGYYSQEMVKELESRGLNYLFRMKGNSRLIKTHNTTSYQYKGTTYHFLTNQKRLSGQQLGDLYHHRWTVEEWYKLLKGQFGGNFYHQKTLHRVKIKLLWQQITSHLHNYIGQLLPKKNGKAINLTGQLSFTKDVLDHLIFPKKNSDRTLGELLELFTKYLFYNIRPFRSYERKSIIDGGKWYRGKGL